MRWPHAARWALAALALLAGATVYEFLAGIRTAGAVHARVYRIGWEIDPPFQDRAADGSPTGIAIELVRSAARSRGISLQWVFRSGSSEASLRNGEADLWPLVTILPERKSVIYISKPYLTHDSVLLVGADSAYRRPQDLGFAAISYYNIPVNRRLVTGLLPHARPVPASSHQQSLQNLCAHTVDAAYMDEFTANAALLSGLACTRPLRTIPLPTLRTSLGVGSTFQFRQAADEIRRGIDDVTAGGQLDRILSAHGELTARNLVYFDDLVRSQQREPWLLAALALFAVLLTLTIAGGNRIRRQRDQIARAERAYRETEQKLRILANSLSEMVFVYDMRRRLVFANTAVAQLTGYSPDELEEADFILWVDPEDRDRVAALWNKLFEGGSYHDVEYRLRSKDGGIHWVIASWAPMFGNDGSQIGVHGSERDITGSKLAEQALRESERQFRGLLENVQLATLIIDATGVISFCNYHASAVMGWSRDEMIGRPARDFLGEDCLRQLHDRTASGGALPFVESDIHTRDGRKRRIQWSTAPLRDSLGRDSGIACLGADITELELSRQEEVKREGEQQFRNVADNAPLMIWVAGVDKACAFANKGWLAFTGLTLSEALGEAWIAQIHPADREACLAGFAAAFDARRNFNNQCRVRRADGEYRWLVNSGVPTFGPDGGFTGYVGSCLDITELKRAEAENLARQKLESIVSLARGIAHDFNNLLAAIVAQSDLAFTEIADGLSPSEQLKNIRTVAIRGAGIVRQLLIYAGQEKADSEPVDISHEVEEMVDLLRALISNNVALRTELAKPLPLVNANPAQIRLLLMNLAQNASESIGEQKGVITIRTALAAAAPDSDAGRPLVQLEVSDTGCGIDAETLGRIFDPYFTTKSPGHGLGLSIVQGIVRSLDGSIRVDSKPAIGTSFRITLRAGASAAAPELRKDLPVTAPSPHCILVVDDEPSLRIASAAMLRRRGYFVVEAADGTEAMEMIHRYNCSIGVILLDLTLPGVTSREVSAAARRAQPDVKVIITTGYTQRALDSCLGDIEIDYFLRKPYPLAELLDLVRRFLST